MYICIYIYRERDVVLTDIITITLYHIFSYDDRSASSPLGLQSLLGHAAVFLAVGRAASNITREFSDVVFADVVFDNSSSVTPY